MFFEKVIYYLNKVIQYLIILWDKPVINFTLVDLLIVAGMAVGCFYFIKVLVASFIKYGATGAKMIAKPAVKLNKYLRDKKKGKYICHVCKNPIDKCTCPENRGVPYRVRLRKWKAKEKELRRLERRKEELTKPVTLKQRGGR